MPRKRNTRYAAITVDIRGSRNIADFRKERDHRLKPLRRLHQADKLILSDYAVTAWDEFEGLAMPKSVPTIILDLRRHFYPLRLWIGVGFGTVSDPHRKPINVFAGGEAFERAREAINVIKSRRNKSRSSTAFLSGNSEFDLLANTIYHLHDTLTERITSKQWQTINARISLENQEEAATKLGVDTSSVSRTLRRGFYNQIEETQTTMTFLCEKYFA